MANMTTSEARTIAFNLAEAAKNDVLWAFDLDEDDVDNAFAVLENAAYERGLAEGREDEKGTETFSDIEFVTR